MGEGQIPESVKRKGTADEMSKRFSLNSKQNLADIMEKVDKDQYNEGSSRDY